MRSSSTYDVYVLVQQSKQQQQQNILESREYRKKIIFEFYRREAEHSTKQRLGPGAAPGRNNGERWMLAERALLETPCVFPLFSGGRRERAWVAAAVLFQA